MATKTTTLQSRQTVETFISHEFEIDGKPTFAIAAPEADLKKKGHLSFQAGKWSRLFTQDQDGDHNLINAAKFVMEQTDEDVSGSLDELVRQWVTFRAEQNNVDVYNMLEMMGFELDYVSPEVEEKLDEAVAEPEPVVDVEVDADTYAKYKKWLSSQTRIWRTGNEDEQHLLTIQAAQMCLSMDDWLTFRSELSKFATIADYLNA